MREFLKVPRGAVTGNTWGKEKATVAGDTGVEVAGPDRRDERLRIEAQL